MQHNILSDVLSGEVVSGIVVTVVGGVILFLVRGTLGTTHGWGK